MISNASSQPPPADQDEAEIVSTFVSYERWLTEHHSLDFDDLVRRAVGVLRTDDALRRTWQERCSTLLVDEVQWTSTAASSSSRCCWLARGAR